MKNNFFNKLLLYVLTTFMFNKMSMATNLQLKGSIEVPISIKEVPEFVIRFQGKQTINKNDGIFSFSLSKKEANNASYLLVCEDIIEEKKKKIENKRSKNTIKNFLVDISKPYKFYELDNNFFIWVQKDLNEIYKEQHLTKIPKGTIIILANPNIVERIETWPVHISPNYIQGPKIVLNNASSSELSKASEGSLARSINSACYFEKNQTKTLPSNTKNKISIPDMA